MTTILTDAMLMGMAERAAGYDRENKFFHEDCSPIIVGRALIRHSRAGPLAV